MECAVKQLSDVEVMQLVQSGNAAAQTELVRRFSDKMHDLAFRITHSTEDAEDAVQDAWASIFQKSGSFEFRSSPSTWIFRVTFNAALMVRRKHYVKHRSRQVSIDHLSEFNPYCIDRAQLDPLDEVIRQEDINFGLQALHALPNHLRCVLIALAVSDFRVRAAAEGLKINYTTLKSRIVRAREHARRNLRHRRLALLR